MSKKKSFFSEWKDSQENQAIASILLGFSILITLGLYVFFTNTNDLQQASIALIFALLGIVVAIFGFIDATIDLNRLKEKVADVLNFGSSRNNLIIAVIIGTIAGFLITNGKQALISPLVVTIPTASLSLFYINIAAPFVEEAFFRGTLVPTFSKLFSNFFSGTTAPIISILVANSAFAMFHSSFFSQEQLVASFVFGLIATGLMYFTKSTASNTAFHFVNNAVATGLI